MRYVLLIHNDDTVDGGPPPDSLLEAMAAFRADTSLARIVDDAGLSASRDALVLHCAGGRITETDGPYAEGKEVVGGFLVIEAASPNAAQQWARAFVDLNAAHWPELEIVAELREMMADAG
jgi:hypothetical protein